MVRTKLPRRLMSPLWRAKNYIELQAGMADPALVARKERERKAAPPPVIMAERTIRVGGGGGGGGSGGGSYTDAQARDAVGIILADSASVDLTYTGATPSITAAVIPAGISHTAIGGVGTNTHAAIDTHIAAANPHSGAQPLDPDLTTLAANITAFGHSLVDDSSAGAARTTLGLGTLATVNVPGSSTQIIFNDAGVLAGDAGLTYGKTNDALTVSGSLSVSGAAGATTTINNAGVDADFVVKGDLDTSLLVTDASTDRVGIGKSTPLEKLDVQGNIALSGYLDCPDTLGGKIFTYANQYGIGIESAQQVYFVDAPAKHSFRTGSYPGTEIVGFSNAGIDLNSGGADLDVRVKGDVDTALLYTDASTDRVGIGTATPAQKLDVAGTFGTSGVNTLANLAGSSTRVVTADASGNLSTTVATIAAGAAGAITQVQFNDGGVIGADAGLTYNKTTDALSVVGPVVASRITTTAAESLLQGTVSGDTAALTNTEAAVKFYDLGGGNWAGVGVEGSGSIWFRTGNSGTPDARLVIRNTGTVDLSSLAGTGARVVEASSTGVLSAAKVPGLDLIDVFPFSGVASITRGNVFTSAYRNYLIELNVDSASAASAINMRLASGGTPNTGAAYCLYGAYGLSTGAALTGTFANINTTWSVMGVPADNVDIIWSMILANPALARRTTGTLAVTSHPWAGSAITTGTWGVGHTQNLAYDGLYTYTAAGTFAGEQRIYGYRNS